MPWLRFSLNVRADEAPRFEQALLEAGAVSVTLEDAADQPVYEPAPGTTPLWNHTRVVGLFEADTDADAVVQALCAVLHVATLPPYQVETLEDREWVRAWMDDFRPMRFGSRLWVVPSGYEAPDPQGVNILLDPGLAFGTGTHPTTALCLEWLDAHPPLGKLVVDYGCGSGILGIAALKSGARHVWAVDNDPQALVATEDNAQKNGIALSDLYPCEPDQLPPLAADLILANILAEPLIALAPHLAGLTAPGGCIVLSGILESQADQVRQTYAAWFDMAAPTVREGWVRLEGKRRTTGTD